MVIADHWDIVSLIEDVRLTLFYEIVKEQVLSVKRRKKIFAEQIRRCIDGGLSTQDFWT